MDIRKELSEKFVKALALEANTAALCVIIKDNDSIMELEKMGLISFYYEKCSNLMKVNEKEILKYANTEVLGEQSLSSAFEYFFDRYYQLLLIGSEATLNVLENYTNFNELKVLPESRILH